MKQRTLSLEEMVELCAQVLREREPTLRAFPIHKGTLRVPGALLVPGATALLTVYFLEEPSPVELFEPLGKRR